MAKVALIMGSGSDFPALEPAIKTLKGFGIEVETRVFSAHRTPDEAADFAKKAEDAGFSALICAAGKAAALPGAMAAHTVLPVIGVPVKASTLDGLDALLSMVQMPAGIPVATVAIDGAVNAALLAVSIIALGDEGIRAKLKAHRQDMAQSARKADQEVQAKAALV